MKKRDMKKIKPTEHVNTVHEYIHFKLSTLPPAFSTKQRENIIMTLPPHKAPGYDQISSKIIKQISKN